MGYLMGFNGLGKWGIQMGYNGRFMGYANGISNGIFHGIFMGFNGDILTCTQRVYLSMPP